MFRPHFLDPLGPELPGLERNTLKLRALQMILVLFYAEELKRKIIELVQGTESLTNRLKPASVEERVPKGAKNPVGKALSALMQDGALTQDDKVEIEALIGYRNDIGHRLHELVADLSSLRFVRELKKFGSHSPKEYDYGAVERLQYFHRKLGELYLTHYYARELSLNAIMFEAAERTFLAEIKALKHKVKRLRAQRNQQVAALNTELLGAATDFGSEECHPEHPLNKRDDGRLTQRGGEICYRLYDNGISSLAVAHLMKISLRAARHRRTMWQAAGGANRLPVDLDTLPRRRFYSRSDD